MQRLKRWGWRLLKIGSMLAFLLLVVAAIFYEGDLPISQLKAKYTNSHSQFIEVNGMDVHYRIEGAGTPLLLIHGTGAMLQTWDGWVDTLQAHFQTIRMDIPAFGLTGPDPAGRYGIDDYVRFVHDFTRAIGIDTFYVAGNSLGGFIAWKYALAHPQQVKKMILLAPSGFVPKGGSGGSPVFRIARKYPSLMSMVINLGTGRIVRKTLRDVYADDSKITPQLEEMYHDLSRRFGNRQAFVERARAFETYTDDALLTAVQCPTLLLWGREDMLVPLTLAPHFQRIPNLDSVFYAGLGHVPQEENPALTAGDALRFLSR